MCHGKAGLKVIKLFSCSSQLSMNFIKFIIVKMPTIAVILTFMNEINTKSESFKSRNTVIFKHSTFTSSETLMLRSVKKNLRLKELD